MTKLQDVTNTLRSFSVTGGAAEVAEVTRAIEALIDERVAAAISKRRSELTVTDAEKLWSYPPRPPAAALVPDRPAGKMSELAAPYTSMPGLAAPPTHVDIYETLLAGPAQQPACQHDPFASVNTLDQLLSSTYKVMIRCRICKQLRTQ